MSNTGLLPSKKGLREAQELFRKLRKQEPSPELVKIIQEITELPKPEQNQDSDSNDIAAIGSLDQNRANKDTGV